MDIAKLDTNAAGNLGAWLDIKHPATGQAVGLRIRILGSNSDALLALRTPFLRQADELRQKDRPADELLALEKRFADDTLMAAVQAWESKDAAGAWQPGLLLDGQMLQCTPPAMVLQVLNRPGFEWLRQQVVDGITDLRMFLQQLADTTTA